ncbi:helix-turn-helix domain-containing protein [Streptomyces sp. NPDC001985]|uniref:helix-turn-helix domain-containing protein n=1 Tax=Streptomyces sp. NPDC001985 TaxID=3154406 RepID=UPI00332C034D
MDDAPLGTAPPAGPVRRPAPRRAAEPPHRSDERELLWSALAATAATGPFAAEAAYLLDQGTPRRCPPPGPLGPAVPAGPAEGHLDRLIGALDGHSRQLETPGGAPIRAIALRHRTRCLGYLVVRELATPSDRQSAAAEALARDTGAALAGSADPAVGSGPAPDLALLRLTARNALHEALARAAASGGGEEGILRTLHEHTGFPVLTEDPFGNPRARAGGGPRPEPEGRRGDADGAPGGAGPGPGAIRDRDLLIAPITMAGARLGAVALVDPDRRATETDTAALEQTALVLAPQLAHERRLAELEPGLRRELVEKLIAGTADDDVLVRAAGLGHDLRRPHRVAVLEWPATVGPARVGDAVERAAGRLRLEPLTGSRGARTVALLTGRDIEPGTLHRAVSAELGTGAGALGVGGPREAHTELPHSYEEAVRALTVRRGSHAPHGGTGFEELGLCRMMGAGDGEREADRFVREWLGPLLDYDAGHRTELTATLSHYLESGGSYDTTAGLLHIHRSTVRYRLQRIREVTGLDLGDVDTRLNLHVASRIHHVLDRPR